MSTLQHKQVKSQKQHLKILGAGVPRGRGPRTDIWGRGPRAEKNKYPLKNVSLAFQSTFLINSY